MVQVQIVTTCLANGFSSVKEARYDTPEKARKALETYLDGLDQGLVKKFDSAQRRVRKGTSEGIKIFYSPQRGIRHYLWIKVYQTVEL